jgi:hypothetical protein
VQLTEKTRPVENAVPMEHCVLRVLARHQMRFVTSMVASRFPEYLRLETANSHQEVLDLAGRRGFAEFQVALNA